MWSEFDLAMHEAGKPENEKVRTAAKVDRNHAEIVKTFRRMGASVQDLSAVGKGCPDVLVGFRGVNVLVEIKRGDTAFPSESKLNKIQESWHAAWAGQVAIVRTLDQAASLVAQIGCAK